MPEPICERGIPGNPGHPKGAGPPPPPHRPRPATRHPHPAPRPARRPARRCAALEPDHPTIRPTGPNRQSPAGSGPEPDRSQTSRTRADQSRDPRHLAGPQICFAPRHPEAWRLGPVMPLLGPQNRGPKVRKVGFCFSLSPIPLGGEKNQTLPTDW